MKKIKIIYIVFLLMTVYTYSDTKFINPSKEELVHVGEMISKNETGGIKEALVSWNEGEEFPSLGIGHFIWYPKNFKGIFDESFPKLIEFYKKKKIKLPKILEKNRYAPWESKKIFLESKKNQDVKELIKFLDETKDIQILFIYERLKTSLDKMVKVSENPKHVKEQFERVAVSKNGFYPLIDYVNFKGEGVKITERYNDEGWGLLQILELMEGKEVGEAALKEFSQKAIYVLERRIENSPKERGEERWRKNWISRCQSYIKNN